jgi:peptide chain release factor 3
MAKDLDGAPVFLAPTQYGLTYEQERWPDVSFTDIKTYQARDGAA